jgi:3-hydroxybutyryl-CoA dehydrogenase
MAYYCSECDKWWNHPIKKCIFCGKEIQEVVETEYKVIGFTQVQVPSIENPKVPYFNYLLEDKNGNKIIIKSFQEQKIGDFLDLKEDKKKKNIYNVGVIGTGQMGFGIAEYILKSGHQTIIKTRSPPTVIISKVKKKLSREYNEDQISEIIKNLSVTLDYSEMKKCDIIIEAVPEKIEIKKIVFEELSKYCSNVTIFATNTSSISIDEIAESTDRPEKFIGMHFFNPVSRMDLIEVVVGDKTSTNTTEWILNFSHELQKVPIIVKNSPGFIVNRLLLPQINEAVLLLEENIAKKEDIDNSMKLGLNHPMGPFKLADFIGIDICLSILETIHKNFGDEKYKPANTLVEMVKNGKLGFKSGEGFYKY